MIMIIWVRFPRIVIQIDHSLDHRLTNPMIGNSIVPHLEYYGVNIEVGYNALIIS